MDNSTEDEFEEAIWDASVEVLNGAYSPFQLTDLVDKSLVIYTALSLLALMYDYSTKDLPAIIDENLSLTRWRRLEVGQGVKQGISYCIKLCYNW